MGCCPGGGVVGAICPGGFCPRTPPILSLGMSLFIISSWSWRVLCMEHTTLTRSGAPGCVTGWSDFSKQHTIVDNYYRFCPIFLIYWICHFHLCLIFVGVESGDQFLLSSEVLSCSSGGYGEYQIVLAILIGFSWNRFFVHSWGAHQ